MSNFQFEIPTSKELLLDSNAGLYHVQNVYILSSLKDYLKQARHAFKSDGLEFILHHFDTYYSVLHHHDKISNELILQSIEDLSKPYQSLIIYLQSLKNDSDGDMTEENQLKTLNILKMLTYLLANILLLLENKLDSKNKRDMFVAPKVRKNNKRKAMEDSEEFIDKKTYLLLLLNVLQLPIYKLWTTQSCEEHFLKLISEVCFTYLENPSIKYEKELQHIIFSVFGVLVKNYSYSITFTIRLTQVIQNYEHLDAVVPEGIRILVEEYACRSLVRELVKELTDWQSDELSSDTARGKNCSNMLNELTILMPELMLQEVMHLLKYMNSPSYTLRNCILSILTEVIIKVLCKEGMTEEEKNIRDRLLSKLLLHINDVNALVRSKVLQNWTRLHTESAVPLDIQLDVLEEAADRLNDKAALVRKNSVILLTAFLECNPYSATLDLENYETELKKETEKLKILNGNNQSEDVLQNIKQKEDEWLNIKDDVRNAVTENIDSEISYENNSNQSNDIVELIQMYLTAEQYKDAFLTCKMYGYSKNGIKEKLESMEKTEQIDFYMKCLHSMYSDMSKNAAIFVQTQLQRLANLTEEQTAAIKCCEETIKYFRDVVRFMRIIKNSIPIVKNFLKSVTIGDVHEAINFFVAAHKFQIKEASEALTVMLSVMDSNDPERRNFVIQAFKHIFLTSEGNQRDKAVKIVNNLVLLLKTINLSDVKHLSHIVTEWTSKGDLDNCVIELLWHMFTKRDQNTSDDVSLAALQLMSMAAKGRKSIIERNINLITELVFNDKGVEDPRMFIAACDIISIMGDGNEINVTNAKPGFQISNEDPMWENLVQVVLKVYGKQDPFSHSVIAAAVQLIYKVCRKPDMVCLKLIKSALTMIQNPEAELSIDQLSSYQLASFCHLLGEIAVWQFTYLDVAVYKELKRRNYQRDTRKKTNKGQKQRESNRSNISNLNTSKISASSRMHKSKTENPDETFMEGAVAEDTDAEFILKVCEDDIVTRNFLGSYYKLLFEIVKYHHKFDDECLQVSSMNALIRYMIVSSKLCEENLQLIMTVLERSKYTSVKNSIITGLADLLRRFPNLIEPWSAHIYKLVKDNNEEVRITAVTTITMLVMEDMLRVKGTIGDLAMCIVDKDERISQMTSDFFHALAQKGNTIYNVLPDIISRLSNDDKQIDNEVFKKVMSFLISLIDKDRQIESLVEKLCLRFKLSEKQRVWCDIAYCLTMLSYNDKSLTRLQENYPVYKTCLENDDVYMLIMSIVQKYKNSTNDEIKNVTKKLDLLLRTGETNQDDDNYSVSNESARKVRTKRVKKLKK